MTLFYLVRHGEPDWNFKEERNLLGALRDYVPLTEAGIRQAEQVIQRNPFLRECELIVSSPFTRSLQTAAIINRTLGLPLHVEYDLHEWVPDRFQAGSFEQIRELIDDYYKNDGVYPSDETRLWETRESVIRRTKQVLSKYADQSKVLVVCHGMVIEILMGYGAGEVGLCSIHEYRTENSSPEEIG
jgi:broad specificity phosphatase PhoE